LENLRTRWLARRLLRVLVAVFALDFASSCTFFFGEVLEGPKCCYVVVLDDAWSAQSPDQPVWSEWFGQEHSFSFYNNNPKVLPQPPWITQDTLNDYVREFLSRHPNQLPVNYFQALGFACSSEAHLARCQRDLPIRYHCVHRPIRGSDAKVTYEGTLRLDVSIEERRLHRIGQKGLTVEEWQVKEIYHHYTNNHGGSPCPEE